MSNGPRLRFRVRTLFVLMAMIAALLCFRRPIEIAYHDLRLSHWEAEYLRRAPGQSRNQAFAWQQHHLSALVRLGRYEKRNYVLQNLTVESEEARSLFDALSAISEDRYLDMGPYGSAAPDMITVYAPSDQMTAYTEVIETADRHTK